MRPRVLVSLLCFLAVLLGLMHQAQLRHVQPDERGGLLAIVKPVQTISVPISVRQNVTTHNSVERRASRVHIVFSTDCSSFQHWQSLVLLDSAMRVGQRGVITRLVSGCSEEAVRTRFHNEMQALKDTWPFFFHVHYTPDFNRDFGARPENKKKAFRFANKPLSVLHWLDHHGNEFRENHAHLDEEIVLVLIDPDFIFLHALDLWTLSGKKQGDRWDDVDTAKQFEGRPSAQSYGLGGAWLKFDLATICSPDPTNCLRLSQRDVAKSYNCGPPYITHWRDLRRLAKVWVEFTPKFWEAYPTVDGPNRDPTRHYAEMYAYVAAAAHLNLPHRLPSNYISGCMVGWSTVDRLAADDIQACGRIRNADSSSRSHPIGPYFIHYCQRHAIGPFRFTKRQVPHDVLSCSHQSHNRTTQLRSWPASPTPPSDLFSSAASYVEKYGFSSMVCGGRCSKSLPPEQEARRVAFIICHLHSAINGAYQSKCRSKI